jgi:hypothetical protein
MFDVCLDGCQDYLCVIGESGQALLAKIRHVLSRKA